VSSRASRIARVVVDTNILLRAAVSPAGPAARLYAGATGGDFRLVLSPHLLREVRAGFFKPHFRSRYPVAPREIAIFVAELLVVGELVPGDFEVDLVPKDPEDNPIVASALEGDAGYVVTNDGNLLTLEVIRVAGYRPIRIRSELQFLDLLRRGTA
jgi:putative PIN family toxin of toxin-antitoxin system